jgi:hypothetical protein
MKELMGEKMQVVNTSIYYDLLNTQPPNVVVWDNKHTEMLSEIALALHYKKLKQTDIVKFYSPKSHMAQLQMNTKMQNELLRVLKNTAYFVVSPKKKK